MVLNEICRLHTSGRTCTGDVVRSTLKSLVVLFPLLGITWLFGLLVFATQNVVFQYLFSLFNTMQGFFIFLFHCLFNSEIRKTFKRKKEAWKSLKPIRYIRKRLSASSVVPSAPHSSLSEKASTFKASSEWCPSQENWLLWVHIIASWHELWAAGDCRGLISSIGGKLGRVNGAITWCLVRRIPEQEVPLGVLVGIVAWTVILSRTLDSPVAPATHEYKWVATESLAKCNLRQDCL